MEVFPHPYQLVFPHQKFPPQLRLDEPPHEVSKTPPGKASADHAVYPSLAVTTIELVITTVESVRDSKSERTSLLNDTIVHVKL
jgi:hypothetical protein